MQGAFNRRPNTQNCLGLPSTTCQLAALAFLNRRNTEMINSCTCLRYKCAGGAEGATTTTQRCAGQD
eukprot:1716480-Alexandrium_andersonii.AAC.1